MAFQTQFAINEIVLYDLNNNACKHRNPTKTLVKQETTTNLCFKLSTRLQCLF